MRRQPLEIPARRILEPERRARAGEDPRRALHHPLGDFGDPVRLGDVAGELEQRGRALGLTSLRLVEAGVLERNRCVAGEHLEHAQVVLVELVEAELRDHDHADHARAERERHCQERLGDVCGALDLLGELVAPRVVDQERLPRLRDPARDTASDPRRHQLHRRSGLCCHQIPAKRDRQEIVAATQEDATVVVVDEEPQLVRDGEPDACDVV